MIILPTIKERNKKGDKYKLRRCFSPKGGSLYRVVAKKDFGGVKKGDVGGFVDGYWNLSQEGYCWIYDDAKVTGEAFVCDDAMVCHSAEVRDYAVVSGMSSVGAHACVAHHSYLYGHSIIRGTAFICGESVIMDSYVWDECEIVNSKVYNVDVRGCAHIRDAVVKKSDDYMVFSDGSETFTYTRSNDLWVSSSPNFRGTTCEFVKFLDINPDMEHWKRFVSVVEKMNHDSETNSRQENMDDNYKPDYIQGECCLSIGIPDGFELDKEKSTDKIVVLREKIERKCVDVEVRWNVVRC